jgi:hypothetical protein
MSNPEKTPLWNRATILREAKWPRSIFDKMVAHGFLRRARDKEGSPLPGHPLYHRRDVLKLMQP